MQLSFLPPSCPATGYEPGCLLTVCAVGVCPPTCLCCGCVSVHLSVLLEGVLQPVCLARVCPLPSWLSLPVLWLGISLSEAHQSCNLVPFILWVLSLFVLLPITGGENFHLKIFALLTSLTPSSLFSCLLGPP